MYYNVILEMQSNVDKTKKFLKEGVIPVLIKVHGPRLDTH